ncbi:ABC transporter ATP-binding protein [Paenibacillus sp. BIHB 4019]|uniref:ABC transporter ATP-binding protein n=1 Tax=Paenibacillus sp. BIHB 4019 TaxID=1870819 RepID=A0A1B2DS96_9BACL|nr:ABC transporter ATP-binding protein [Paenibacillus sp. BIHB 4019]ANY70567.1 ABC transporter ATP-binding protein [Paenibacillus sp. BIHB 4019]
MAGKKGIARLLELAGERRGLLAVSGIFSALSAICMLIPYVSVYFIVKELLEHAANPAAADSGLMIRWGLVALGGLLASLLLMYGGGLASHIAAFRILYGLRVKLSSHIGRLPLGWLNSTSTGAVKKTLDQNVEKVETFVAHQLPDLIHMAVTIVIMIIAMFWLNVWLAAACLIPIVLGFVLQMLMMSGSKKQESIKQYYDSLERLNGSAIQYVRGMPVIKVFGQTVFSFRQFYEDMVKYRDFCVKYTDQFQYGFLSFKVVLSSFAAFILPVGVFLLQRDPGNVAFAAVLLFFLILSPGITAPMFKIMHLASGLRDINEGVERIDKIFAEQPVPEPKFPKRPVSYEVAFQDVSFSYGQADSLVLSNVSFVAQQGEVTALVGPSGAGKSTVASLLPRFWDVREGAIQIGGVDIRDMASEELMNTVAFVFQQTFLFYDTVYNNIAIGVPDAKPEAVYAAAKAAQCDTFINQLPQGYHTLIGEGGVYLSGGEEQRIAVARAILKNAPVLVLDEATAFADPENEFEMQLALKELTKGKTVIVIAHRLSTIRDASQIIVMDEGRIAERGKHEQLIAAGGLYSKLWNAYTAATVWRIGAGKEAGNKHGNAAQYNSR